MTRTFEQTFILLTPKEAPEGSVYNFISIFPLVLEKMFELVEYDLTFIKVQRMALISGTQISSSKH